MANRKYAEVILGIIEELSKRVETGAMGQHNMLFKI
jgi:hypothetical protein